MKRSPSARPPKSSTSPPPPSPPASDAPKKRKAPPGATAVLPASEQPALQDVEVIFVGMDLSADSGKPISLWLTSEQYQNLKSAWGSNLSSLHLRHLASAFADKAAARRLPGNLYKSRGTLQPSDHGQRLVRVSASDFKWTGRQIEPSPLWPEVRNHVEQIVIGMRLEKMHADRLKVDELALALKSIRKIYQTTDRTGKAALEVMVLRALRDA